MFNSNNVVRNSSNSAGPVTYKAVPMGISGGSTFASEKLVIRTDKGIAVSKIYGDDDGGVWRLGRRE